MFVFLDEAGDTGLKIERGSSRIFTIAMVIFSDGEEMQKCDRSIHELRIELKKENAFEFHFHDNSKRVRHAFLKKVAPFEFSYHVFVLNKDIQKMWNDSFKTKESLYKMVSRIIFENARMYIKDAYVVIDKSGSRDFQKTLAKYLKGIVNTSEKKVIRKFRAERSSQNNLLQLADYVVSICHRKASGKSDADMYYRAIFNKEMQSKKWP